MLSAKLWRWGRRIGPWERFLSSLNYLHNWLDSQMPLSPARHWPLPGGAWLGSQFLRRLFSIGEQRSVNIESGFRGKCIPGIRVMCAIRAQSEPFTTERNNAAREVWWAHVSWSEVWQMPAGHDAVTLIMGYFLACWANLIIIPPGHGIKRREKHPFIRSFPIPWADTNTLGEMILQTKYFSLSLVQYPSSSLNWSHRTHFLWTRAKVFTNQSIRSNEIRPSLSWFWSLFSILLISVM